MSPGPIDRDDVLCAIEDALDDGAIEDALALCRLLLGRDPHDPDAMVLMGDSLLELGELEAALAHYERAHAECPDWEDAETSRASVLLELGRLEEAIALADQVLSRDKGRAAAHRTRAIACELLGDEVSAERHYRRAHRLNPEFTMPCRISSSRFMDIAQRCLDSLPDEVLEHLENVEIRVLDVPSPELLGEPGGPLSMLVLGYFVGTPLGLRSVEDPHSWMPCFVFLFKKNHERICVSQFELERQVDITLRHEVGHFLGLDEHDMVRLGLD